MLLDIELGSDSGKVRGAPFGIIALFTQPRPNGLEFAKALENDKAGEGLSSLVAVDDDRLGGIGIHCNMVARSEQTVLADEQLVDLWDFAEKLNDQHPTEGE
jgi:hypothetical protein